MFKFFCSLLSSILIIYFFPSINLKEASSDIITFLSIIGGAIFTSLVLTLTICSPLNVRLATQDKYEAALRGIIVFFWVMFLLILIEVSLLIVAKVYELWNASITLYKLNLTIYPFETVIFTLFIWIGLRMPPFYKAIMSLFTLHMKYVEKIATKESREEIDKAKKKISELESI